MRLIFVDSTDSLIFNLRQAFLGIPNVTGVKADLLSICSQVNGVKAIVCPGSSHGKQDATSSTLSCFTNGIPLTNVTQKLIDQRFLGQQPIGTALIIPCLSAHQLVSFIVYAPTMMILEDVSTTYNAYSAFRAALLEIFKHNACQDTLNITSVICHGFTASAGLSNHEATAKQMRLAWDSLIHPISHDDHEISNRYVLLQQTISDHMME